MNKLSQKQIHHILLKYDIQHSEITFIRHNENMTYKVKNNNDNFLLRIHEPITPTLRGIQHTFEGLQSEMMILSELKQRNCSVQTPLTNQYGQLVTNVYLEELEKSVFVTMLKWLEGDTLQSITIDQDILLKMVHLQHQLHIALKDIKTDVPIIRPIYSADKYQTLIQKLHHGVTINLITRNNMDIVEKTLEKIKKEYDEHTATNPLQLIHGDYLLGNIVYHQDEVSPIDFGFLGYGLIEYDLGITLTAFQKEEQLMYLQEYQKIHNIKLEQSLIEAGFILGILAAFSFHIHNEQAYEWIQRRIGIVCKEYCQKYIDGEHFL